MERCGFVLAGGHSSRMGTDKALLPYLHGATLIEHVMAKVKRASGSVIVVGPIEKYRHLGVRVIPDLYPGAGPLAGIHAALSNSTSDWNLMLACDMPAVPCSFLEELFRLAEEHTPDCVAPVSAGDRLEPLCAVYHRRCVSEAAAALTAGRRKMTDWLAGLKVHTTRAGEAGWFLNANTPAEWEMHLRDRPGRKRDHG